MWKCTEYISTTLVSLKKLIARTGNRVFQPEPPGCCLRVGGEGDLDGAPHGVEVRRVLGAAVVHALAEGGLASTETTLIYRIFLTVTFVNDPYPPPPGPEVVVVLGADHQGAVLAAVGHGQLLKE